MLPWNCHKIFGLYQPQGAHKKRTDFNNLCAFPFCFTQKMVVILAAVWYNKSVKIKAYQGFSGFQPWLFSCSPVPLLRHIGLNGVQEAAGSNPVTRTKKHLRNTQVLLFCTLREPAASRRRRRERSAAPFPP